MKSTIYSAIIGITAMCASVTAGAAPMFYIEGGTSTTAETNFINAVNGAGLNPLMLEGFEGVSNNSTSPLDLGPISISSSGDIDTTTSGETEGSKAIRLSADEHPFVIAFDSGTNALSIDLIDFLTPGIGDILVSINGGIAQTFNSLTGFSTSPRPTNNVIFFGVVDTMSPISSISFSSTPSGDVLKFDRLQYSPVPEPGTLALFGLGLVGLGFARRKKAA